MSGICDTCSLSKGCRKPIGGVDSCRRYVRAKESNYQRLFGTPERAAKWLMSNSLCYEPDGCERCSDFKQCTFSSVRDGFRYDALLEWLRGDA